MRRRGRAYNLVVLMVAVTVFNVMVAKALPMWSAVIQRDKEEELIFRGLQYAEAIRLFQARHGRPPQKLLELIETEPRFIRQLWNNPMMPKYDSEPPEGKGWELISPNQPTGAQPTTPDGQSPGAEKQDDEDSGGFGFGFDEEEEQQKVGPFIGVHSKEGGEAFRTFFDGTDYGQWNFTADLFDRPAIGGDPNAGLPMPVNAKEIGRAWPDNVKEFVRGQQAGQRPGGGGGQQRPPGVGTGQQRPPGVGGGQQRPPGGGQQQGGGGMRPGSGGGSAGRGGGEG